MKKIFLATILAIGLFQIGFSQNFDKAKLDSYFNALEMSNKFMGSVAVSKDEKIIYKKSVGFSDVENKIKADQNSKYRIGSISKTFTAILILKAVEEKKLSLNQTIDKYFPTIRNANKITVQHLLSHRSGIHSFTNDKGYLTWNTLPHTEKEMIEIIRKGGSDFEPNSKATYSNSNFVLLTYILEKTFKKSYSELLRKYITEPAGLTNTYLGKKINAKNNECQSYSFIGSWKRQPETDISIPLGAGGIVSTPTDLVKFSNALFDRKFLKEESLELMKIIKDQYGLGLHQIHFYDKTGYGHGGSIDGFSSLFSYFSDGNISYALTSNGTNFDSQNIFVTVLSAAYNRPYDVPDFKTISISSEDLNQYLGVYSSKEIPLKITITKNDKTLIAQATGQSALLLDATAKNQFKFVQAGIVLEFNPSEKTMLLIQAGQQFTFVKE